MYNELMNYSKTKLKVMNEEMIRKNLYSYFDKSMIFSCEKDLTSEEKLEIMDKMNNGDASYIKAILMKWEMEKKSLPTTDYGAVKTVSRKAWLKRNDDRGLFNQEGEYKFSGRWYESFQNISNERSKYAQEDIVNEWFGEFLGQLKKEEIKFFNSQDEKMLKLKKLKEYNSSFGNMRNSEINDIVYNGKASKDVSMERLNLYLKTYENMEKSRNQIIEQLNLELHLLEK